MYTVVGWDDNHRSTKAALNGFHGPCKSRERGFCCIGRDSAASTRGYTAYLGVVGFGSSRGAFALLLSLFFLSSAFAQPSPDNENESRLLAEVTPTPVGERRRDVRFSHPVPSY